MSVSIKQHFTRFNSLEAIEMKQFGNAVQADLSNLKSAFDTLVTKLNTDFTAQNAAVTGSQLDTNYASSGDLQVTA